MPAEPAQLERVGGDKRRYDLELRPGLMAGRSTSCRTPASSPTCGRSKGSTAGRTARPWSWRRRRGGRDQVGCIILGRGENEQQGPRVARDGRRGPGLHRLRGRPHDVLGPARRLRDDKITRDAAVDRDRKRYREWVDVVRKGTQDLSHRAREAAPLERAQPLDDL